MYAVFWKSIPGDNIKLWFCEKIDVELTYEYEIGNPYRLKSFTLKVRRCDLDCIAYVLDTELGTSPTPHVCFNLTHP